MGKTRSGFFCPDTLEKHPHVHGEDEFASDDTDPSAETPLRAWGRLSVPFNRFSSSGNTPTCMGKTSIIHSSKRHTWKHPHVHGEDGTDRNEAAMRIETPPRAWGRLSWFAIQSFNGRNTPTCMGKTPFDPYTFTRLTKHPHVHGEDLLANYLYTS